MLHSCFSSNAMSLTFKTQGHRICLALESAISAEERSESVPFFPIIVGRWAKCSEYFWGAFHIPRKASFSFPMLLIGAEKLNAWTELFCGGVHSQETRKSGVSKGFTTTSCYTRFMSFFEWCCFTEGKYCYQIQISQSSISPICK